MDNRENIEEKIQDLIDGNLSQEEAFHVRKQIDKDEHLRLFYNTLKQVDGSLHEISLFHPSGEFTQKVMLALHRPQVKPFDVRSLMIFIGLMICAAVGLMYASQANIEIPDLSPISTEIPMADRIMINIPAIDLPSSELLLNAFYFGILFLALIYLDRVILRQLFRSKRFST